MLAAKQQTHLIQRFLWDFPGCPMVKTPCLHCKSNALIPGQGTKIPCCVALPKKKKKKKKRFYASDQLKQLLGSVPPGLKCWAGGSVLAAIQLAICPAMINAAWETSSLSSWPSGHCHTCPPFRYRENSLNLCRCLTHQEWGLKSLSLRNKCAKQFR